MCVAELIFAFLAQSASSISVVQTIVEERRNESMQKRGLLLPFVLFTLTPLFAQQAPALPKFEVYGGYSALLTDMEASSGWNASVTANWKRWLGAVADFSGHYGGENVMAGPISTNADRRLHSILFGPRFSYRTRRVTPFVHSLFGFARETVNSATLKQSETNFALALGGGLDISLSDRLALRLIQADYHGNQLTGGMQHHVRLGAGLTVRIGNK